MKFVTHSISTKTKPKTLSEMFKAAQTQAALNKTASSKKEEVKVASVATPTVVASNVAAKAVKKEVKVAEDDKKKGKGGASDEAESSGQLKVEPLHQKGESTQEKPGDLDTMKNEKEAGSPAGPAKKDDGDAESSGQLKVEPLHQEGESTQEKPGDLDTQKKDEKKAKATQTAKKADFTVTAELTPKEKEFLRSVWSNFWTKKFIDAVLGAGPGA